MILADSPIVLQMTPIILINNTYSPLNDSYNPPNETYSPSAYVFKPPNDTLLLIIPLTPQMAPQIRKLAHIGLDITRDY